MKKYFLIIMSAFFMGLAQQPIHLGFLAWFSFVPVLYFLEEEQIVINGAGWQFTNLVASTLDVCIREQAPRIQHFRAQLPCKSKQNP